MTELPQLSDFPHRAGDTIRYGDTDRQGHVNNAVFSTLLETGRVAMFYSNGERLADDGCEFVLVRLVLDYRNEINWPGTVEVGTRLGVIGRSSASFEQGLFQNGKCVATAESVVVQMNETTRRSQALSDAARERLERLRV